jgi:hypothetical protein
MACVSRLGRWPVPCQPFVANQLLPVTGHSETAANRALELAEQHDRTPDNARRAGRYRQEAAES